jgi:hypothetical protein
MRLGALNRYQIQYQVHIPLSIKTTVMAEKFPNAGIS